jgi:hypothetical protein
LIGTNPFLTPFNVFVPLTSCLIFGVHSRPGGPPHELSQAAKKLMDSSTKRASGNLVGTGPTSKLAHYQNFKLSHYRSAVIS